jgi:hypothetical protein
MGVTAKANVLWMNGQYFGNCSTKRTINIPCDQLLSSPVDAWVVRKPECCGNPEKYDVSMVNPNNVNALQGVWVAWPGFAAVIDAALADTTTKCNGCCGTNTDTVPILGNNVPDVVAEFDTSYSITRTDDGNQQAFNKFALDYYGQYNQGTLTRSNYAGGVSTYTFQAPKDPKPQGTDAISAETARVFDSNVAPAPSPNLKAQIWIDGVGQLADKVAATLAALQAALAADANYNVYGTWTQSGGALHLSSQTVNNASVSVQIAA